MGDVFLITVDALRADHFDEEYFSHCWDKGFEDFAHFTNAYANGVATPLSFPSIHTGHPVESDGNLRGDVPTIAELYDGFTFAITNNGFLRPDRGYDRGFDSFTREPELADSGDATSLRSRALSSATELKNRVKSIAGKSEHLENLYARFFQPDLSRSYANSAECILDTVTDSLVPDRGLYWAHLMEPHHPYYPQKITDRDLDLGQDNTRIREINRKVRGPAARSMEIDKEGKELPPPTDEEVEFCRELYGELVRYVDRMLADFFQRLRAAGRWEESIIVVTADHGEAFGESGVFQHDWTQNPIDPLVEVPLAVKYPGNEFAGERFDHTVQTGDLLATLSDILDWDVENPPNTRPVSDPAHRPVLSKSNAAVRVTTDVGYAIRRGDEIVERSGDLRSEDLHLLRSTSVPTVETLAGETPGLNDQERQEVEERLEYLGYM